MSLIYTAKFIVSQEKMIKGVTEFLGEFNLFQGDKCLGTWEGISGRWGRGALPYGAYLMSHLRRLDDIPAHKSFKKEGFPWLIALEPQFPTDRTQLCIHPDGGIYGTLGCVGILENDISLFDQLKSIFKVQTALTLIAEKELFLQEIAV